MLNGEPLAGFTIRGYLVFLESERGHPWLLLTDKRRLTEFDFFFSFLFALIKPDPILWGGGREKIIKIRGGLWGHSIILMSTKNKP